MSVRFGSLYESACNNGAEQRASSGNRTAMALFITGRMNGGDCDTHRRALEIIIRITKVSAWMHLIPYDVVTMTAAWSNVTFDSIELWSSSCHHVTWRWRSRCHDTHDEKGDWIFQKLIGLFTYKIKLNFEYLGLTVELSLKSMINTLSALHSAFCQTNRRQK
jgi:hypothetical protein